MKIRTRNEHGTGFISRKKAMNAIERGWAYVDQDERGEVLVFGPRPRPRMQAVCSQRPAFGPNVSREMAEFRPCDARPGMPVMPPALDWCDRMGYRHNL